MNKSYFVCLSNSKKNQERCIAGVELTFDKNNYKVKKDKNDQPVWLRPVSKSNGAMPESRVGHIKLLDIVEIEIVDCCPNSHQVENIHINESGIKVVSQYDLNDINLLLSRMSTLLFGNKGKAVHDDVISTVPNSLILIKVEEPTFIPITDKTIKNKRLRTEFVYNKYKYNLPVTDLQFIRIYHQDSKRILKSQNYYYTISLGGYDKGWHSKLVAGIIFF